jgi:cystathionine gamma-lyase
MTEPKNPRFATRTIHGGQAPDPSTGAIMTPIYATSTYVQTSPGVHQGLDYGRSHNPTRWAWERAVADLEGGAQAFAFASGLAAIATVLELLPAGAHVVSGDDVYGGTFRLFDKVFTHYGVTFSYVDTSQPDLVERAFTSKTKLLFVETPTNPVLRITDIAAMAALAHRHGTKLVVDNTFASPCLQRPLDLGADLVIHSTTKYLNGHSDSVGGVVIVRHDDDLEWFTFIQNAAGAILGPFDAWLVLRGTKTLPIRMAKHSANGLALATFLERHSRVRRVIYPGLRSHPQHELAKRQMPHGFGGMLAFEVDSFETARDVLGRFELMALAESLGSVETLVCHPASMTHASVPPDRRKAIGLSDSLIRISTGIEDVRDLEADLDQALGGRADRATQSR